MGGSENGKDSTHLSATFMKKYLIFLKTYFYDSTASYQKSKENMEWKALKASKAWFMSLDTI